MTAEELLAKMATDIVGEDRPAPKGVFLRIYEAPIADANWTAWQTNAASYYLARFMAANANYAKIAPVVDWSDVHLMEDNRRVVSTSLFEFDPARRKG